MLIDAGAQLSDDQAAVTGAALAGSYARACDRAGYAKAMASYNQHLKDADDKRENDDCTGFCASASSLPDLRRSLAEVTDATPDQQAALNDLDTQISDVRSGLAQPGGPRWDRLHKLDSPVPPPPDSRPRRSPTTRPRPCRRVCWPDCSPATIWMRS